MIESPDDGSGKDRKRVGFAWKSGKLELYSVDVSKPTMFRCSPKPIAGPDAGRLGAARSVIATSSIRVFPRHSTMGCGPGEGSP